MTDRDDRYADLSDEPITPARRRLLQDLEATYRVAPPSQVRAAVAGTLAARARAQRGPVPRRRLGWAQAPVRGRPRWAALAATATLVLGSLVGVLHLQAPAPVSAATLLRQALTTRPAASSAQVIHETSTLYLNGPFDLPNQRLFSPPASLGVDQWTQLGATGAIGQQVTTMTDGSGGVVARGLQTGTRAQIYGALQNAISTHTAAPDADYAWLANPLGITDIPALLAAVGTSATASARLLPQQTIAGTVMNVVQIRTVLPGGSNSFPHTIAAAQVTAQLTTMYIDAQTNALRGVDVSTTDAAGAATLRYSLRVTRYEIVPLADVPAGTFTLAAPSAARLLPPSDSAPAENGAPPRAPQATLLLAQLPPGLQLASLGENVGSAYVVTSIVYCGSAHCNRLPALARQFVISFGQTRPPSAQLPPVLATGQQRTLTVAGRTEQAYYLDDGTPAGARRLLYQDGLTLVELYSQGLSKADFFAATSALVDAQTHPALIPAKWRMTDAFGVISNKQ